jgi:hypothetical protein
MFFPEIKYNNYDSHINMLYFFLILGCRFPGGLETLGSINVH